MRGPDSTVGPVLGDPVDVDRFQGRHLRAMCCPCIIECIAFASTCTFSLPNSVVSKFEQKL
jgi:hypothetical protein